MSCESGWAKTCSTPWTRNSATSSSKRFQTDLLSTTAGCRYPRTARAGAGAREPPPSRRPTWFPQGSKAISSCAASSATHPPSSQSLPSCADSTLIPRLSKGTSDKYTRELLLLQSFTTSWRLPGRVSVSGLYRFFWATWCLSTKPLDPMCFGCLSSWDAALRCCVWYCRRPCIAGPWSCWKKSSGRQGSRSAAETKDIRRNCS